MEDKLMLETGIKGKQEVVVSDANPQNNGSGTLDVFRNTGYDRFNGKDRLDERCLISSTRAAVTVVHSLNVTLLTHRHHLNDRMVRD